MVRFASTRVAGNCPENYIEKISSYVTLTNVKDATFPQEKKYSVV